LVLALHRRVLTPILQYGEKLGAGAFKTVLVCFDRESGTQLAWNQISLHRDIGAGEFKRLYKEISILKQVQHPNIIKLFEAWVVEDMGYRVFISELMTSGTLAQFRKRLPVVSLNVIQGGSIVFVKHREHWQLWYCSQKRFTSTHPSQCGRDSCSLASATCTRGPL
jgi:serine/threonine protein kinase